MNSIVDFPKTPPRPGGAPFTPAERKQIAKDYFATTAREAAAKWGCSTATVLKYAR